MKARLETKVEINLIMSKEESNWLIGVMQDPFISEEDKVDREMRKRIIKALAGAE